MKKKVFVFSALITAVLLVFVYKRTIFFPQDQDSDKPAVLGMPGENKEKDFSLVYNNQRINYAYFMVEDAKDLYLYPNFSKPLTAKEAWENYACKALLSGGFYDKNNFPLGLFYAEKQNLAGFRPSATFNAVFSINLMDTPRISRDVPKDPLRLAIQSGPLLIENGFGQKLKIKNDDKARRVVLGVTGENKAVGIVFYDKKSVLMGPNLADLPQILEQFEMEAGIILADAVNLDGGSASAFYNGETFLAESVFSGSFFCLK